MSSVVSNYQIGIDAKPEDVFAYVSDLTKHGEWSENLTVESVSDGEVAVGREYRSTGKMMGKQVQNTIRITEFESPSRISFETNDGSNDFLQEIKLSQQGEGTLLERRVSMEMNPMMALMFKLLAGPMVANPSMNKSLKNLKAKMEHPG
jgi:uncharacterized protein YndB with AHSA1/START domain